MPQNGDGPAFGKQTGYADAIPVNELLRQNGLALCQPRLAFTFQVSLSVNVRGLLAGLGVRRMHRFARIGLDCDRKTKSDLVDTLAILAGDMHCPGSRNSD